MESEKEKSPAANGACRNTYENQSTNGTDRKQEVSFAEINAAALAAGVPAQWYPRAKRYRYSLRVGNLLGDLGASLWICLRTGAWKDHASGDSGGDLISLYAAREGIGQNEAKQRVAESLGNCWATDLQRYHNPVNQDNCWRAREIWKASGPIIETQAAHYLSERKIFSLPQSLRFHPAAYHGPTRKYHPAMIAAITRWPEKSPSAVHRTFLAGNRKAGIEPNRMMLGEIDGSAVRLAPVTDVLAVAEGVETALSFQQMTGIPTWAVLSCSNYYGLILPPNIKEIIIAADNDQNGLGAAYEAAGAWARQGRKVKVVSPEQDGKDWNDVLMSEA